MNMLASVPTETALEAGGHAKGVAIAVVSQNQDDAGMGRVRVRYPWHAASEESYWARMAAPMSGPNRGFYFLPEIGDEVLVAFERGDLRFPYIVGALWNGQDKAPQSNSDGKNDIRQIRTRAGHKLTFDDGAQERVQLELSDGKRLTFDDQGITLDDANGSSVVIDSKSGTVTISAAMSLSLKAPRISIEATTTMDISANGRLAARGATIELN
ncbi:hypothetical protein B0G71_1435 [Paraburkholderia sp. BL27I4N3]|uniref:phage baseplate assembly protein V n=1 Tax=Paraburkholderia sp. BL27I4N3 TaxID=1938805 RepID=UPI000E24FE54|nr:phage baseplate assembly protein V [Paraburkholderia sp. BL27I4N3]REE18419.1 hypothetical protein B0G71_1435 [Paraburkholderia sp. BL27I4N3]